MISLLYSLTLTVSAKPFHQLSIEQQSFERFTLDQQERLILPSVIVTTSDINLFVQLHPELLLSPLGPKGTHSWLIDASTPAEAIELAHELSVSGWSAWVDMSLPKKSFDLTINDPNYSGQWYLDTLDMLTLWESSWGDSSVRVAVIDSGIDITHPDLTPNMVTPYDAFSDDDDPSPNPGEYCWSGANGICDEHGTAVAGIAVASRNDSGIVGICPECSLIPIKMLGDGNGALSADIASFEHAIANDAAVINNSWGYTQPIAAPQPLVDIIQRAQTETRDGKGAVVVFAAGNDNREVIEGELCGIEGVVCVSAIDSYGRPTAYTNYGADVDVAAPSATVSIAPFESLTTNFGGTSAAAPVVSGLAGWILSVNPDLTSSEVADIIIDTAEQSPLITPDEFGHHAKYGYGVVSPLSIHTSFFPPEAEEPSKGACNTLASTPSSVMFSHLWTLLFGLIVWVRRR